MSTGSCMLDIRKVRWGPFDMSSFQYDTKITVHQFIASSFSYAFVTVKPFPVRSEVNLSMSA